MKKSEQKKPTQASEQSKADEGHSSSPMRVGTIAELSRRLQAFRIQKRDVALQHLP